MPKRITQTASNNEQIVNLNTFNQLILKKIIERGRFYIVQTTLRNQVYLRVSLMNPLTKEADLVALLNEIEDISIRIQGKK